MRREGRAVSGQRQAEGLGQAIHRVGGEHARARAAGRAGRALDDLDVLVAHAIIRGRHHRVDEIERLNLAGQHDLAGFHRPAGDEDGGDVQPHRSHQHARRDLVAIGDADHRIGAVRVHHVLDGVGDQLARRERIEHSVMAHSDAVVDSDGVELLGDPAGAFDLARHELAEVLQMDMARHELREGVHDGDDRLAEIAVLHAGGAPEAARSRHVAAVGGGARAIGWHPCTSDWAGGQFVPAAHGLSLSHGPKAEPNQGYCAKGRVASPSPSGHFPERSAAS